MTLDKLKEGDRVRIHPANDWFMRGVVYGTVIAIQQNRVSLSGTKLQPRVRIEHNLSPIQHRDGSSTRRRIWIHPNDILEER